MRKISAFFTGLVVLIATTTSANAANILFAYDMDLSGDGGVAANAAADTAMIGRLNALGHNVTLSNENAITAASVSGLTGSDFIVVSASASSGGFGSNDSGDGNTGAVNSLGTAATIVVMEGGSGVFNPLDLTGGATLGTTTGTDITILSDDGYVTAGFSPGALTIYSLASNIGTMGVVAPAGTNAGSPPHDFHGTALASVPVSGFPAVSVGTHTVGDNTIVVLPFHNGSFSNVNANGLQLFDNVFGTVVPEPSSMLLMFGGLSAMAVLRRRRKA